MKKNILIIMNDLNCGGSQKALISLLETIDYSLYCVDLFLFSHVGIFMNKIPKEVNLLEEPENYKYFDMSIKKAIVNLIKNKNFKLAIYRILAGGLYKTEKNVTRLEQRVWRYISKAFIKIEHEYDIAIGFQEKNPIYFCVDKVNSARKIGWIHTDYSKIQIDVTKEEEYFRKLDNIITVGDELVEILKSLFPNECKKILSIHNIVSPRVIRKLANEKTDFINIKEDYIKLVSVGRLVEAKGFDMAIESCYMLKEKGYKLKWYVIGEGGLRNYLENLISEKKLEHTFILLGQKENPYPYIKQADIYVQTSIFEGKSIAIDEAKTLCKPIVTTNFTSAKNQIQHNTNGIITDINSLSIAEAIEILINNTNIRYKFSDNLSKLDLGTENEINKIYQLINSDNKIRTLT